MAMVPNLGSPSLELSAKRAPLPSARRDVSYKLLVRLDAGAGSEHGVTKTYGDFWRLDHALAKELPLCRLPPRPRPDSGLDEAAELGSTSFRDRLNMYVTLLTSHQDARKSYSFRHFFGLCTEHGKLEQNSVNTTELAPRATLRHHTEAGKVRTLGIGQAWMVLDGVPPSVRAPPRVRTALRVRAGAFRVDVIWSHPCRQSTGKHVHYIAAVASSGAA